MSVLLATLNRAVKTRKEKEELYRAHGIDSIQTTQLSPVRSCHSLIAIDGLRLRYKTTEFDSTFSASSVYSMISADLDDPDL